MNFTLKHNISIAIFVVASVLLAPPLSRAEGIYPTYPGTSSRDYSKPGYEVKGNTVYQTYPGTNSVDYSKPAVKFQNGTAYQTYPGTNSIDYSKPGYRYDQ